MQQNAAAGIWQGRSELPLAALPHSTSTSGTSTPRPPPPASPPVPPRHNVRTAPEQLLVLLRHLQVAQVVHGAATLVRHVVQYQHGAGKVVLAVVPVVGLRGGWGGRCVCVRVRVCVGSLCWVVAAGSTVPHVQWAVLLPTPRNALPAPRSPCTLALPAGGCWRLTWR